MKKWFTSDWHLGEDRIGINGKPNLFYRPFKSINEQNYAIMDGLFNSDFKDGDELWHLGDVLYNVDDHLLLSPLRARYPNSKFHLIIGNYDEGKLDILKKYFDTIQDEFKMFHELDGKNLYLNHYPTRCLEQFCPDDPFNDVFSFAITGHIHGLWKVQKQMINVGVDAWHFLPVSEDEIKFAMIACEKYYDKNVFPY